MLLRRWNLSLLLLVALIAPCRVAYGQVLSISTISPTSGPSGSSVMITGVNFGTTQGSSTISLNGTSSTVVSWTDTAITIIVPATASSGTISVAVDGETATSAAFTVDAFPSGWSDGDVGSVGVAGSASYASGTFTVSGSGQYIYGTSDAMHFAHQALSGDGTIVARVVSLSGGGSTQAGVMIRETLGAGSANAFTECESSITYFFDRSTTAGNTSYQSGSSFTLPYWTELVRSGNVFSAYTSSNGLDWVQLGSSVTISMASNVYVGLAVSSDYNSSLATATFDNVSISSAATPAPVITSLSATTGLVGSQVTINGSGFGTTQDGSVVTLNNAPVTINSWSATAIAITIPSGAASGDMVVSVAPGMNDSNPVYFTITSQPLPTPWQDGDVGAVGVTGSATYSSGTFTVEGSGNCICSTADSMHFVYQPLSGDGTIVARVVSSTGGEAGIMIRETLDANAASAFAFASSSYIYFYDRSSTGASMANEGTAYAPLPYWIELVRSGNSFSVYTSLNGLYWAQLGSTQTITMATNVYVGLAESSQNNASLATAVFDNASLNSTASPAPIITLLSPTTGPIGSQVAISGSGFGNNQGTSVVTLAGVPLTVNTWSDGEITATIPSAAISGLVTVAVAPSMNASNPVEFDVTTQPLPASWLDEDIGAVGVAGSATYSSGTFTVEGSGNCICSTADSMHFVYQPLSGNGTIIARIVSSSGGEAGIMIRETLDANASFAFAETQSSYMYFYDRSSTGTSMTSLGPTYAPLPYWVELVRSGSSFSAYTSLNGLYWTQLGSTQTITMATDVYVGLAVSSQNNSSLATATFDNVSVSSTATPAPVISSLSATTGTIGSQVTINGSGFGTTQNGSVVTLNDASATINSWSATAIIITIPSGATSGNLVVSVAPAMNNSNPVYFAVTTQPLPTPWQDSDVGAVGVVGNATYSSGTFTVEGSGNCICSTGDAMHFAYQPLSGDGTIVARVVTSTGGEPGIMIRESLNADATSAFAFASSSYTYFYDRSSTGASMANEGTAYAPLPYWVKLVRSSGTFSSYISPDGVTWTQLGTTQTFTMTSNSYVGLAVSSQNNSSLATATFDNVSVTVGTSPFVTSVYPVFGGIGTSVAITGSNFGTTQGTSTVSFNGTASSSITSWSGSQIVATVPTGATTGQVAVTVSSVTSPAGPTFSIINPVISSITPPAAQPGSVVTIAGSGFGGSISLGIEWAGGQVSFNGVVTNTLSWTDTSITVQVPATATTGSVTILENGVTSNGVTFTVLEPLSITSIYPMGGAVGTAVTITGAGFGSTPSNSTVAFDGVNASITSWSDTSIVAVVPTGASTGPVSVTVAANTDYGPTFQVSTSIQLTDSLGNVSTYVSVIAGGKWYVSNASGSGCSSCTVRGSHVYGYDSRGNILSQTDQLGNTTSNAYDSNNNKTSITQPTVSAGTPVTSYTYNSFGEVLTMTDPLGHVTTNTYDSKGNLLTVTTPPPQSGTAASVTQFAYNSLGELTKTTDPLGRAATITYTSAGQVASITDAQSNVTTYAYDSRGNRTSITDALSHVTTFAYDSGNRLTTITYPDSTTSTFTYDYRGRRITATDQNGKTTSYTYDDADRLTTVTDAASNVTTYAYDSESNPLSITDANGHETSFAYDAYGRVTQTTFPSTYVETYDYDADNNLTSKTDRKGQTILYVYDARNRLTEKTYPDSTTAEYTYDLVGRILGVTDPSGTYGFSYDNMGRLTGTTAEYAFLSSTTFTNAYSYDANSNRTGYTAPDSSTNTYSYDTLNRLTTLANSWAGSFGFSYDALGRRTQMTRPNSVTTNYSYDNLSRLTSVLHQLSGSTIDGAAYTLDSAGNRTAKTDEYASVTSNYGYNSIYELTSVTQGSTTTESYTYDPVGNRTASLGVSSYTTNSSNEMTANSNASYTYDYNGNTTSKTVSSNTTSYSWDYENRLASVALPGTGGTATFKYDPFGRRIQKVFTTGSTTTTTNYLYDGDDDIEEMNASGSVVARYAQTQNVDEPLAESRSSTTSFYEVDGLGSVTSLTNSSGTIANSYTYDSFGRLSTSTGSITNPFQYTGRDFDSETGLRNYRARYYDPTTGRFISEDSAWFDAETNLYAYVINDPVDYLDPSGLIRYNYPPPRTVPVTGQTAIDLQCLEHCLQCVTHNPNLNLLVTGGAETSGHSNNSYHYINQAVDISFRNNLNTGDVFQCAEKCGFTAGGAEPAKGHWHLQLTPGNGSKLLPPMLPMKPSPCCK